MDEFRLLIFSLVLGKGKRLFDGRTAPWAGAREFGALSEGRIGNEKHHKSESKRRRRKRRRNAMSKVIFDISMSIDGL